LISLDVKYKNRIGANPGVKVGPEDDPSVVGADELANQISWHPDALLGMPETGLHLVLNNGSNREDFSSAD
jgi:hypothetical protein